MRKPKKQCEIEVVTNKSTDPANVLIVKEGNTVYFVRKDGSLGAVLDLRKKELRDDEGTCIHL